MELQKYSLSEEFETKAIEELQSDLDRSKTICNTSSDLDERIMHYYEEGDRWRGKNITEIMKRLDKAYLMSSEAEKKEIDVKREVKRSTVSKKPLKKEKFKKTIEEIEKINQEAYEEIKSTIKKFKEILDKEIEEYK